MEIRKLNKKIEEDIWSSNHRQMPHFSNKVFTNQWEKTSNLTKIDMSSQFIERKI